MGRRRKLYDTIVGGKSDPNIPFEQTATMLVHRGGLREPHRGFTCLVFDLLRRNLPMFMKFVFEVLTGTEDPGGLYE